MHKVYTTLVDDGKSIPNTFFADKVVLLLSYVITAFVTLDSFINLLPTTRGNVVCYANISGFSSGQQAFANEYCSEQVPSLQLGLPIGIFGQGVTTILLQQSWYAMVRFRSNVECCSQSLLISFYIATNILIILFSGGAMVIVALFRYCYYNKTFNCSTPADVFSENLICQYTSMTLNKVFIIFYLFMSSCIPIASLVGILNIGYRLRNDESHSPSNDSMILRLSLRNDNILTPEDAKIKKQNNEAQNQAAAQNNAAASSITSVSSSLTAATSSLNAAASSINAAASSINAAASSINAAASSITAATGTINGATKEMQQTILHNGNMANQLIFEAAKTILEAYQKMNNAASKFKLATAVSTAIAAEIDVAAKNINATAKKIDAANQTINAAAKIIDAACITINEPTHNAETTRSATLTMDIAAQTIHTVAQSIKEDAKSIDDDAKTIDNKFPG